MSSPTHSQPFNNVPSPTVFAFLAGVLVLALVSASAKANDPGGWKAGISLEGLAASTNSEIAQRARTLQQGLARRTWTYQGDDGVTRTFEDAFHSVIGEGAHRVVEYQSKTRIPLDYLSKVDQTWITNILRFQAKCEIDAEREVQLRQEIEQKRLQELKAEADTATVEPAKITVAQIRRDTSLTVSVGNQNRTMKVNRGETFPVLELQPQHLLISFAGQPAVLSRQDARVFQVSPADMPPSVVLAAKAPHDLMETPSPLIQDAVNPVVAWPRRLDIDIDFIQRRGNLQVKVNQVIQGGVGESMGIRRGDTIVRVNHQELTSKQQFRSAVLSNQAPVLHVVGPAGKSRLLTFGHSSHPQILKGLHGHLNYRNEFEIDFITQHDVVTRQLKLSRGDVILAVADKPVHSVEAIAQAVRSHQGPVPFLILRQGHFQPTSVAVFLR